MKPFLLILILLVSCSSKKEQKTQTQFPDSPLETACNTGAADTCLALGQSAEKNDMQNAAKWFEKACKLKSAVGCLSAGSVMLSLNNVPKAIEYFAQGCDFDEAAACYGTGIVYSGIYGGEPDNTKAISAYQRACELGLQDGCAQVGIVGLETAGSEADTGEAVAKLEASCRASSDIACYSLGQHFTNSAPDQSTKWFEKGCEFGDGTSCLAVGFAYASGKGVTPSETKSYEFFKQGCLSKQKDWVACSLYGYADYKIAKTQEEKNKATALLKATCENEAEGCFRMALIDPDPGWLKKACTLNADKCDIYQRYLLKAKNK